MNIKDLVGKTIQSIEFLDSFEDELAIKFTDGTTIAILTDGDPITIREGEYSIALGEDNG